MMPLGGTTGAVAAEPGGRRGGDGGKGGEPGDKYLLQ